jgi:hypothetical protein
MGAGSGDRKRSPDRRLDKLMEDYTATSIFNSVRSEPPSVKSDLHEGDMIDVLSDIFSVLLTFFLKF